MIKNSYRIFTLIIIVLIIIARAPSILIEPRFWAEEGTVYFAHAFNNPWYDNIFFHHRGYYHLFANIATIIAANLVPLKYAPFVTTYLAFIVLLIPFTIVLWGNSIYWNTYIKKIFASFIILFVLAAGEIWLTSVNAHFIFPVIAFLILADDIKDTERYKIWFYRILLLLSGLTGVISCFLSPLFLLKAKKEKTKEYLNHALIIVATTLIQVSVFLINLYNNTELGGRFVGFDLATFTTNYISYFIITPILGYLAGGLFRHGIDILKSPSISTEQIEKISLLFPLTDKITINKITHLHSFLHTYYWIIIVISSLLAFILIRFFSKNFSPKEKQIFLGSFLLVSILSLFASLSMSGGLRYAYAPSVMLMIMVMCNIQFDKNIFNSFRSIIALTLLSISIMVGIMEYKFRTTKYINYTWPKWEEEIKKWEKDKSYKLKIWPQYEKGKDLAWEDMKWELELKD